jgi:hypothetical protein
MGAGAEQCRRYDWNTQLAGQTRLLISAEIALTAVRDAWGANYGVRGLSRSGGVRTCSVSVSKASGSASGLGFAIDFLPLFDLPECLERRVSVRPRTDRRPRSGLQFYLR